MMAGIGVDRIGNEEEKIRPNEEEEEEEEEERKKERKNEEEKGASFATGVSTWLRGYLHTLLSGLLHKQTKRARKLLLDNREEVGLWYTPPIYVLLLTFCSLILRCLFFF